MRISNCILRRIPRHIQRHMVAGFMLGLLCLSSPAHAGDRPGRLVDVGGHRLYIHCSGSGSPTVVIDAGMGGFSLEWQHVQSRLAGQVRVCSYDRAGYGYSDSGPLPRTSTRIAQELHTLLERAAIPAPYLLVGHSFGGYNIRAFADAYPDVTAGLVLIDASHPGQFARFPRKQLPAATKPDAPTRRTLVSRPLMPANYPEEVRQRAFVLMATYKARQAQAEEFRSFMASAAEIRETTLPDVPILVLSRGRQVWPETAYGNKMERIWAELQADLGQLTARTLHLVAANSGHSIHFDQPDAVSSAVLLTATAARGRWHSWAGISRNDDAAARSSIQSNIQSNIQPIIQPILNQATYLAQR